MEEFTKLFKAIFSIEKEPNSMEIINLYKTFHQNDSKLFFSDYIINFILSSRVSSTEKLTLIFETLLIFYNRSKIGNF